MANFVSWVTHRVLNGCYSLALDKFQFYFEFLTCPQRAPSDIPLLCWDKLSDDNHEYGLIPVASCCFPSRHFFERLDFYLRWTQYDSFEMEKLRLTLGSYDRLDYVLQDELDKAESSILIMILGGIISDNFSKHRNCFSFSLLASWRWYLISIWVMINPFNMLLQLVIDR